MVVDVQNVAMEIMGESNDGEFLWDFKELLSANAILN